MERSRDNLGRGIEHRDTAAAELFHVPGPEEVVPGVRLRALAEDRLEFVNVVADAGRSDLVRDGVLVARIHLLKKFHLHRIEVLPVRDVLSVELPVDAGPDLPREEVRSRHDQIISGVPMHHLPVKDLVAVIDIIGDPDAGLPFEVNDDFRGNVVAPVVDAEDLLLLPCLRGRG